jgi:urea transporter
LFPALAIPYTLETWFAVVILGAFIRSKVSLKK